MVGLNQFHFQYYTAYLNEQVKSIKNKKEVAQTIKRLKPGGFLLQKFVVRKPVSSKRLLVLSFFWYLLFRTKAFPFVSVNKRYGRFHGHVIHLDRVEWLSNFHSLLFNHIAPLNDLDFSRNIHISGNLLYLTFLNFYFFESIDFLFGRFFGYFMRKFTFYNLFPHDAPFFPVFLEAS